MQPLLEVKNLTKSYGKFRAVDNLSFVIQEGCCFGLLGPNGAGKSTTIEMIEQVIPADSGQIFFKGQPVDAGFREQLGVQFQETALPPSLTVKEALLLFCRLYEQPRQVDELVQLCNIESFLHKRHDRISGGQRQRLLLAVALCGNPELLLLDEPTTGLDPQSRRKLWDVVKGIKKEGKSIILTTHYMDEAEELCDDIGIVDQGHFIARGSPDQLLNQSKQFSVVRLPKTAEVEVACSNLSRVYLREHVVEIHCDNVDAVVTGLVSAGVSLVGLSVRRASLEDFFLELTGKDLRS